MMIPLGYVIMIVIEHEDPGNYVTFREGSVDLQINMSTHTEHS